MLNFKHTVDRIYGHELQRSHSAERLPSWSLIIISIDSRLIRQSEALYRQQWVLHVRPDWDLSHRYTPQRRPEARLPVWTPVVDYDSLRIIW